VDVVINLALVYGLVSLALDTVYGFSIFALEMGIAQQGIIPIPPGLLENGCSPANTRLRLSTS
jgi:hypothetical protein